VTGKASTASASTINRVSGYGSVSLPFIAEHGVISLLAAILLPVIMMRCYWGALRSSGANAGCVSLMLIYPFAVLYVGAALGSLERVF
jgi:hypothetical protein